MTSAQYLRDQPTQTEAPPPPANTGRTSVSRRGLLGAAGAGLVGLAAGAAGGYALGAEESTESPQTPGTRTYPFYGEHQAGILTPVQDRLHFAAFDVITDSRAELVQLLKEWTVAAARMTQGLGAGEIGPTSGPYGAPPDDTGEAIGLPAAGLTITFGLVRRCSARKARAASDSLIGNPPRWSDCHISPRTISTHSGRMATYASRPVPMTPRSLCMPSATSPASHSAALPSGGQSSVLVGPRRPRPARQHLGT
jgi:hypothetical protein